MRAVSWEEKVCPEGGTMASQGQQVISWWDATVQARVGGWVGRGAAAGPGRPGWVQATPELRLVSASFLLCCGYRPKILGCLAVGELLIPVLLLGNTLQRHLA